MIVTRSRLWFTRWYKIENRLQESSDLPSNYSKLSGNKIDRTLVSGYDRGQPVGNNCPSSICQPLEYFSTISTNVLFRAISFDDNPTAQVNKVDYRQNSCQYYIGNLQNAHQKIPGEPLFSGLTKIPHPMEDPLWSISRNQCEIEVELILSVNRFEINRNQRSTAFAPSYGPRFNLNDPC